MHISNKLPLLLVMACLFLCCTTQAFAAPTLTISSSGNGIFVVQGRDFQTIGGAKIIIGYDTSTLANPRVTQGELTYGSVFLPNTYTPGIIRMGVVSPNGISGSGAVASIAFDLVGSSPGVIQSLQADEVIGIDHKPVATLVRVINPTVSSPPVKTAGDESAHTTADTLAPPAPLNQPAASTGTPQAQPQQQTQTRTVTAVGVQSQLQIDDKPTPPAAGETRPARQPGMVPASPPAAEIGTTASVNPTREAPAERPGDKGQPDHVAYKSVLEQFRTFTGQKTPQELTGIFTRHTMPGIRQEPAVAMSDGASKLHLSVRLLSPEKKAPNFSLKNATLVSLKIEGDSIWLIEVLPAKGVFSATLTMLQGDTETEIPLLVAPPLPGGTGAGQDGKLAEADFVRFLTERGTDKAPRFDLNGDGKRDYIDDYIFTANYLLRKGM